MQSMQKQHGHIQQAVSEVSIVSLYFRGSKPAHMNIRTPVMRYTETQSNNPMWFSAFDSG